MWRGLHCKDLGLSCTNLLDIICKCTYKMPPVITPRTSLSKVAESVSFSSLNKGVSCASLACMIRILVRLSFALRYHHRLVSTHRFYFWESLEPTSLLLRFKTPPKTSTRSTFLGIRRLIIGGRDRGDSSTSFEHSVVVISPSCPCFPHCRQMNGCPPYHGFSSYPAVRTFQRDRPHQACTLPAGSWGY